ncbi:MAG: hypothetical protein AAFX06_19445, partial [Planctomycetota bacterium]
MELETRRVLNGDGAFAEIVVDAGEQGDDGQSDLFEIDVEAGRVTISVNGEVVNQTNANEISQVRVIGSTDNDQIRVDFADRADADFDINIDGRSGDDSLTIGGQDRFQSLIHLIQQPTSGTVTAQGATNEISIEYRDLEAIEQELDSAQVLIDLSQSDADALLELGASSRLEVFSDQAAMGLSFRTPDDILIVETGGEGAFHENRLEVIGDGSGAGLMRDFLIQGDELDDVRVTGEIVFDGDSFGISAGEIDWNARLDAIDAHIELAASESLELDGSSVLANQRGEIELTAQSIRHDGEIIANGGRVLLDSGDTGTTLVNGLIDASSVVDTEVGGEIRLLGMHVGLLEQAVIDVSGSAGGGTALIGGDYQGENSEVRNAERTYVSAHAVVMADAIVSGDGGRVIFWANQWTRFAGTVSARGGATSGSGGFVEVSGKQSLDYRGTADLSAPNGEIGLLFLDPQNIVIA